MRDNRMESHGKTLRLVGTVLVCALAMSPVQVAGSSDGLEEPLRADWPPGFQLITPPADVWVTLRAGMPQGLAIVDAGVKVTYEQAPDTYATNFFWSNDELLSVFLGFHTANKQLPLRISVNIADSSGVPAFKFKNWYPQLVVDGVIFGEVYVGALGTGVYKVTVTIKQGDMSVGQRFWFVVKPPQS